MRTSPRRPTVDPRQAHDFATVSTLAAFFPQSAAVRCRDGTLTMRTQLPPYESGSTDAVTISPTLRQVIAVRTSTRSGTFVHLDQVSERGGCETCLVEPAVGIARCVEAELPLESVSYAPVGGPRPPTRRNHRGRRPGPEAERRSPTTVCSPALPGSSLPQSRVSSAQAQSSCPGTPGSASCTRNSGSSSAAATDVLDPAQRAAKFLLSRADSGLS